MKPVVKFFLLCLLLTGCRRAEPARDEAIRRSAQADGVSLRCSISETNLLTGATAVLKIEVETPPELTLELKPLHLDGFLIFAEAHPAYRTTENGTLLYRHIYQIQARQPGTASLPEISIRTRNLVTGTEPRELALPPLPITVRGVEVKTEEGLNWSQPVEVSL
jgi:hypothetical protein